MTTGAITPRRSAYDEASRSAADAVRNSADYLRRARALRQREAVALVRAEGTPLGALMAGTFSASIIRTMSGGACSA